MVLVTLDLLTPDYFSRYTKAALLFWSFRVVLKSLTDYIRCRYKNCIAIRLKNDLEKPVLSAKSITKKVQDTKNQFKNA